MTYTYTVCQLDGNYRIDVRFPDKKMAWAIFDAAGNLLRENGCNVVFEPFPSELKDNAAEIFASLPLNKYEGKDVYIRFNELPECGQSTNWATGQKEKGVSAYECTYDTMSGEYFAYGALQGAELSYLMQGVNIYFITGAVVGKGADGEPLLSNVETLGRATYNKETGGYKQ